VVWAALDEALRPALLDGLPAKSAIRHKAARWPPPIKVILQAPQFA